MTTDCHASTVTSHLHPSLLLGVPSIDSEHDDLVKQLDKLASQPDAIPNSERFTSILSQLADQINSHFTSEEKFFKSLPMPADEIASHVKAHTDILNQYAQLNFELMQGKALNRTDILVLIKSWIVEHVIRFDLNIKKYLPSQP